MRKKDPPYASIHAVALDRPPRMSNDQELFSVEAELNHLLHIFGSEYDAIHRRLSGALRSGDAASEALHDTYLKLESGPRISKVREPARYLYRMAINLAKNRQRHEAMMQPAPVALAKVVRDDLPNPERTAVAKSDLAHALRLLHQLPRQRREIFLARWRDDLSQAEIACRLRLHKRTIQKELARAEQFLRSSLRR